MFHNTVYYYIANDIAKMVLLYRVSCKFLYFYSLIVQGASKNAIIMKGQIKDRRDTLNYFKSILFKRLF